MSTKKESPTEGGAITKHTRDSIRHYFGEQVPVLCSLQDAALITGLSYDFLLASSKTKNKNKVHGFRPKKTMYRVFVAELPEWMERISHS